MIMEKMNVHGQTVDIADKFARDMIGSGELKTSDKTLVGAINEIKNEPLDVTISVDDTNKMLMIDTRLGDM